MSAEFVRELQENVAKYGKENHATFLMVQAIKVIQNANAARIKLEAMNAELAEALDELVNDESPDCIPHKKWVNARAALEKRQKETP